MAITALVVMLIGGVGAALAQAGFFERRVTRGMARAVCVVTAGDCWRDREPCAVGSTSDASSWNASVAILRFGDDRLALVERRSDGTYAVTLERAPKGGLGATGGAHVKVHLGGVDLAVGGEVTASLLARLGKGRTWIVGSEAEARSLVAAGGASRPPDVTYDDRAWLGAVGASLGIDAGGGDASADVAQGEVTFDQHWGTSTDRRTGRHTVFIDASWAAEGALLGGVLGLATEHQGEIYAIEVDASGRPLDLRVTAAGRFGGSRDLPAVVQPVAGLLAARGEGERRFEVTAHLDLTDARSLAAARDLVDAMKRKHARATPTRELRRLIDERGTIEARVLTEQASSDENGLEGGAHGVALGYARQVERRERQLVAATSRGLDGQWITRTDCVA
ncbi:MAG TPA: hypothetical protein VNT03_11485 [Baekduia sp.]|nr:hypothetical protein [Baekduia sp.]